MPGSGLPPREFGFMPDLGPIAPDFNDPLPDEELAAWEDALPPGDEPGGEDG